MTCTIDRMLMTPSVFFDPLIPGFAVEGAAHGLRLPLRAGNDHQFDILFLALGCGE